MSDEKRIEEMAETMKSAAIFEMRKELTAAGYTIVWDEIAGSRLWFVCFDTWSRFMGSDTEAGAIGIAYAHLQKERKYVAMEAALKEILQMAQSAPKSPTKDSLRVFFGLIADSAKEALGE